MVELLSVRLVVVDVVHLAASDLEEPDRGGVADAEIPAGVDRGRRVIRHVGDAALPFHLGEVAAEIGADDRRVERALELLRILLRRHVALRLRELRCGRRRVADALSIIENQAGSPCARCQI